MALSSSFRSRRYDVFPSFSGEDIRKDFLSYFLKELDQRLVLVFKDNEIQRGGSLDPELVYAIRNSRIAVVLFSKNYASSSWCLNELLEIVKCQQEFDQIVIPVFFDLEPFVVRKQTGDFGRIFEETCKNKTEQVKNQWRKALTDVANMTGYHFKTWRDSEALMIEEIVSDILGKLNLSPSNDFEDFVGLNDHITKMNSLLDLESVEVKMVGIWGASGIGKTTIARALYSQLSHQFQSSIFIDCSFLNKSLGRATSDEFSMKLQLQKEFLSHLLNKKDLKVDHLDAVKEKLQHRKVLIVIDDLDDYVILETLADQTLWFGSGSRIIVVTNDKRLLRVHGIDCIYEAALPSEDLAIQIVCQSAFKQKSPPTGFEKLVVEVARSAGSLPLGLRVLGSSLRGKDKEEWEDALLRFRVLDGKIEKTVRVSYDMLNEKEKALFRHIACLFNLEKESDIKLLLEDSNLDVNLGLKRLVDKSLIHIRYNIVEMPPLLQKLGKEIVYKQSIDVLGKREFLVDPWDICDVLEDETGTIWLLGISLDIDEIDELHIHENAFKRMRNLRFLKFFSNKYLPEEKVKLHLPDSFGYFPLRLRLLCWDRYPMKSLPSNFYPENLVKLKMENSKLEKLWEGIQSLRNLREINLWGSEYLKELPNLSTAINLEELDLSYCSSLVELPYSIQNLHKLEKLYMLFCKKLETLPTRINLPSLDVLDLTGCSRLRNFPDISSNISMLNLGKTAIEEFPFNLHLENIVDFTMCGISSDKFGQFTPLLAMLPHSLKRLCLSNFPSLVELPSSIQNFTKLNHLGITDCINLEILSTGINLQSLDYLCLRGCLRLKSFPNISTNISELDLGETGIEEVPRWIENFSELVSLTMEGCSRLKVVSLNISKLKYLEEVNFSDCGTLTRVDLSGYPFEVAMEADNIDTFREKASSSLPDSYVPKVDFNFIDCFNLDQESLLQQETIFFNSMTLSGEEVPSYFTHRAPGNSLTNIPLLQSSPCQPFFKLRACAIVDTESTSRASNSFNIQVYCRFKDRLRNHFNYIDLPHYFKKIEHGSQLLVFDCCFTLNEDNAPLTELNYDHVDIQFHLVDDHSQLKLKGCGIHLLEDGTYLDDRPCNPFILPLVFEGDNNTGDNLGGSIFYKKSTRGDNFLGEVNSDATSNSRKSIENKMVGPVKEENKPRQHRVFINFWGEEVRFSFISHLVSALKRKEVEVVQEKCEKRGEDLGNTFRNIEDSYIAIVIFSSTYTKSRWCLEELVKIKEQMNKDRIIPIFYNVKISHVKELGGDFGFQFWNLWRAHRDHRIINWKQALESVASIKGFELEEKSSESDFITLIVKEVLERIGEENSSKLSSGKGEKHESFLNKCPEFFGLEQRMKQLEHILKFDCDETRIIGVVGIAGIGKTTLSMMLHEKWSCDFTRSAALLDIRNKFKDNEWLKKTLFEVLLEGECYRTEESLKDELLETKVFVVLDDVSNKKQLEFLLGDLNWISKGSKIVITSRDKSLIKEFVHDTYVLPPLNYGEALELFRYHAIGDNVFHPTKMYKEFVDCIGGNPLVIKLLVKKLHGRDEAQWETRQRDLTCLGMVILNIFRSSCLQLSDKQKDVFLDIACFFRSENDNFVRSLLDSGDYNATDAESEVRDLTHKCMIAISGCRVEMHDLMHMFGKIFSSQAFVEENGGKSRLWYTQEIIDALTNQKDTKNIRGIFFDMSAVTQSIVLDRTTFSNMCNLRYLKIYESCCPRKGKFDCKLRFPDGLRFPLEEIRYFHWLKFPLKELPRDFRPENLVDLRLPYSKIERVWEDVKDIPKLKWVDLSHSRKLLNLSVLARAESLQRLNLEGCTNLEKFPREMQSMKSLVYLNMRGCIRLMSLPKMNLISLKTLILSYCSNLKEFQVISKKLEVLHLDGTAIKELPVTIQKLQRLVVLNLKNCKMLECLPNCLGKLKVLEEIILSGCSRLKNLPDVRYSMKHVQILLFDGAGVDEMPNTSCFIGYEGQTSIDVSFQKIGSYGNPRELPRGVSRVSSLRRLSFSGNDFVSLQNDIVQLYNLIWLDVKQCKKLTSVPMLPPRLQYFDAHGCDSLEKVANPLALQVLTEQIHATYNFSNCNKLDQDATDAIISYTQWKSQMILDALSRYNGGFSTEALIGTCFPGWEVPAWFSYRAFGSSLEPKLPPHWCDSGFIGIALCAVILFPASQNQQKNLTVKCNFEFKNEDGSGNRFSCHVGGSSSEPGETIESSHVFISYASKLDIKKFHEDNEEGCICTEASFRFQVTDGTKELGDCEVLKCGFSLVYASDDLQVNSGAYRSPVEVNQDITSSGWVKDFFGYIFLAFSCVIVFAILSFGVIVFAPQHYLSFLDFYWSLLLRILFFVAFGLFLKQEEIRRVN